MLWQLTILAALLAAPDNGLVAHYPMSKVRGAVAPDVTGNGYDGVVHGGAKRAGSSLRMDGEDDYIEVDPKIGQRITDTGSLEIWCRPQALQGGLINFSTGSYWKDERLVMAINTYSGGNEYLMVVSNGASPQQIRHVGELKTGQWTHVVMTYDRLEIRAYQDGVLVRAASRGVTPNLDGVPMWIGRCLGLGKEYFKGLVDEVRVYDRALSAGEIVERFKEKAERRGMKATRYFNQPKLAVGQRRGAGWITAEVEYGWMQPLPAGAKVKVTLNGGGEAVHDVAKHLRLGRVRLDAGSLAPGNQKVRAAVIGPDGKQIGKAAEAAVDWQGRDPAFAGVKVLNNLVWQLIEVDKPGRYTFRQPRYRWVWVNAAGSDINIRLNGKVVLTAAGEAMRRIDAGEHQLEVAGKVKLVTVRSVPETIMARYGSGPHVKPHGPWDRDYFERYILPHHNTLVVGVPLNDPFIDDWRKRGGKWLAHVLVPRAIGEKTVSDVDTAYDYLSKALGIVEPRVDGVIADEFGNSEPHCALYAAAYDRLGTSKSLGHKMFYPYANDMYDGEEGRELIRAVMRGKAGIASKHYLKTQPNEQAARDFIDSTIVRRAREMQRLIPGSVGALVVCFGYFSAPPEFLNQHPQVNYRTYLDMQFHAVANDPAYFGGLGLMTYLSSYSDDETVRWAARLMRHYGIEGNTERATLEPYFTPHLTNGDFIDGLDGWQVSGQARIDKVEALGWLQGRYPRSGSLGDQGLVLESGASATQTVKGLTPGRVYALRMMSNDFGSMAQEKATGLKITIEGATMLDDQSFDHVQGNCYSHMFGPYKAADTAWMTYHWRLLRATGDTAKLTITNDAGGETLFNWVSVSPYFEKAPAQ